MIATTAAEGGFQAASLGDFDLAISVTLGTEGNLQVGDVAPMRVELDDGSKRSAEVRLAACVRCDSFTNLYFRLTEGGR